MRMIAKEKYVLRFDFLIWSLKIWIWMSVFWLYYFFGHSKFLLLCTKPPSPVQTAQGNFLNFSSGLEETLMMRLITKEKYVLRFDFLIKSLKVWIWAFLQPISYGKPYVLFVFHQQEILCKSMGILRGGTTVGEKWCPPTWRWATSRVSAADQACASWVIHCLRRYWYLCWADTSWLTISWADMLLLRRYWYISWANTGLSLGGHRAWTAIRPAERYTSVIPWLVGATSYLGDTHLGWRYIWGWYTSSYDYLGDTQLTTYDYLGATLHTLKLLGDTYLVYRPKSMFTNLRARFWKGLCYTRAFVKLVE